MKEIIIGRSDIAEMVGHAREVYPEEACGILAGRGNAVLKVVRMRNADRSPVTYRFHPEEQQRAMKGLEGEGLRMVGIYHSHTHSPAYPSETDISRAFFPGTREPNFPEAAYVIVSLSGAEPELKAYAIGDRGVEEVRIIER